MPQDDGPFLLVLIGRIGKAGDGIGRQGPAANKDPTRFSSQSAQGVSGFHHDAQVVLGQTLEQQWDNREIFAAAQCPERRPTNLTVAVPGQYLQPVLLTDQLLTITDLDCLDQSLLSITGVEQLGVLEFGQQLVDRQYNLLLLDPTILLLNQTQVARKAAATSLHARSECFGSSEPLVENLGGGLGQE